MFESVKTWRKVLKMLSKSKIANKMDQINNWSFSGKKLWGIKSIGRQTLKTN